MANKKMKELRNLGRDELLVRIRETEVGLFKNRIKLTTAQLDNVSTIWKDRKDLARMKGLLTEMDRKTDQKAAAPKS